MTTKTCHGSCHGGAVRFAVELDLAVGTGRCNGPICTRTRNRGITIKPRDFRRLVGEDALSGYPFGTHGVHHLFCRHCGVRPFGRGCVEQIGGDPVSVNLACLDDAEPQEPVDAPLRYMDGRHDNWMNPPVQTRHL